MESPLALPYSHTKLLAQNLNSAVIRHLQVIDTRHDRRQVVIGSEGWFAGLADNRKHWRESLEACGSVSMVNVRHGMSRELTSNRELGATGDELQKVSTLLCIKLAHGGE